MTVNREPYAITPESLAVLIQKQQLAVERFRFDCERDAIIGSESSLIEVLTPRCRPAKDAEDANYWYKRLVDWYKRGEDFEVL